MKFKNVLCVDLKSVLQAIPTNIFKERSEIIFEIKLLIHCLSVRGTEIHFCWIPSHCGFAHNNSVDIAAKNGAKNIRSIQIDIPLSHREICCMLRKGVKDGVARSAVG